MASLTFQKCATFSTGTVNVDTVMINGRIVKRDGKVVELEVGKTLGEAQANSFEIWVDPLMDRPEHRNIIKA